MSERITAEQMRKSLEWALDEIDVLSNQLVAFAYPQAMPLVGRDDEFDNYRAACTARTAVPALILEVERLREALSAVLADMPIIDCDRLHHAKKDRHGAGPCPVETRLTTAIARARAALQEDRDG